MIGTCGTSGGRRIASVFLAVLLAANGLGCARDPSSSEPGSALVAPAAADDDGGRIRLDEDGVRRAGIQIAVVARAEGRAEVDAFGRVLDPLPLIEAVQARTVATTTAALARAEYQRVARLHGADQNASTRDLETARATLDKASADLNTATARLTLGWGAAAELGDAVVDGLAAGRVALVRVDVPAGVALASPTAVTIDGSSARILGRAPTVDPLVQGEGWLALLDGTPPRLGSPPRPGAVLAVVAARAPERTVGVGVPVAAVVWVDGRPALYVQPAAGEFERRTVTLGPRADDRWIVTTGLAPGEQVVVAGAARLRSVEVTHAEPDTD